MWNIRNGLVKFYELRIGNGSKHVVDTCYYIISSVVGGNYCQLNVDDNVAYITFTANKFQYKKLFKELEKMADSMYYMGVFMNLDTL